MSAILSCEQCRTLLPYSIGRHLDLEEQVALEVHLASCRACRNEFSLWEAMPAALTALQGDGLSPHNIQDAWAAIETRLPASTPTPPTVQETAQWNGAHPSPEGPSHAPGAPSAGGSHILRASHSGGFSAVLIVVLLVAVSSGLFYYLRHSPTAANSTTTATPVQLTYQPTHILTPGEMLPNTMFYDVQMLSPDEGWAVGGTTGVKVGDVITSNTAIYHYQHGHWTASSDVVADAMLYSLSMVLPDDGWAGGMVTLDVRSVTQAAIMLHYDGQHWRRVSIPAHDQINKVKMLSATEGWAVTNDRNSASPFLHYQQGVWSNIDPGRAEPYLYTGFSMVSPTEGWAAGYQGAIGHYHDGQWTTWPKSVPGDVTSIAMRSASDGWMIAATPESHTGKPYQQLIALHFDGKQWKATPLASVALLPIVPGIALSGDTGWLAGKIEGANDSEFLQASVLFQYAHGKWNLERFQVNAALTAVSFTSPAEGWAVGYKSLGSMSGGVLLHYLDGHWAVYQA